MGDASRQRSRSIPVLELDGNLRFFGRLWRLVRSRPPKYVDYDGLGMRIPMLIISPYAKQGYVSHVHYEHGSILRFIEDQFHLKRLAASDRRAISPAKDAFDFTKPPRKFVQFQSPYDKQYFLHQPDDYHSPDDQ